MTTVALDYLDWSVCAGGRHLTGHLTFDNRERVELERHLSLREAKELIPDHSDWMYDEPYFRVTNRFEDWDSLVRVAVRWCRENLKGSWVLTKGSRSDLTRILAAEGVSETRVRILNLITEKWDKLSNPERDRETMNTFYAAWRAWKP